VRRRRLIGAALAAPWPVAGLADVRKNTAQAGREVGRSFFGIHVHHLALHAGEQRAVTPWPDLPFAGLRLWDSGTLWSEVVPARGQWRFVRMDAYVNAATAMGADLLYTLGGTPRWASARPDEPGPYGPGCAAEPADLAHWEDYVRFVFRRYRGRIAAYEVWNEPNFSEIPRDRGAPGFYTGSLAVMLEMTRIARRALDELDPDARLCSPGFVNGPDRLEMFLAGGGARWVQAIDYHLYARDAGQLLEQIAELRALMRRQGVSDLPLWNTEFGNETWDAREALPPGAKATTDAQAAASLAQFMVVNAATLVDRCYYYAWDNERSGMFDRGGRPGPRHIAMARVQSWLDGAVIGPLRLAAGTASCELRRASRHEVILWNDSVAAVAWRPVKGLRIARVESLFGDVSSPPLSREIKLSREPVLVELSESAGHA
jgi:hypothetical protein